MSAETLIFPKNRRIFQTLWPILFFFALSTSQTSKSRNFDSQSLNGNPGKSKLLKNLFGLEIKKSAPQISSGEVQTKSNSNSKPYSILNNLYGLSAKKKKMDLSQQKMVNNFINWKRYKRIFDTKNFVKVIYTEIIFLWSIKNNINWRLLYFLENLNIFNYKIPEIIIIIIEYRNKHKILIINTDFTKIYIHKIKNLTVTPK